jgi:hypothetical protein
LAQFTLALGDGVAVDSRNPFDLENAASPSLPSEKARQQPSQPFVCLGQQSIHRPMVARNLGTRMELADRTKTYMHLARWFHGGIP